MAVFIWNAYARNRSHAKKLTDLKRLKYHILLLLLVLGGIAAASNGFARMGWGSLQRNEGGLLLCRLRGAAMVLLHLAEQIQHAVGAFRGNGPVVGLKPVHDAVRGVGETGKTGVQLVWIVHLGDHQDHGFGGEGDRLDHDGDVLDLKAELVLRLLHHLPEQVLRLVGAIGQFTDLELPGQQIFPAQGTADLIVVYSFYLHIKFSREISRFMFPYNISNLPVYVKTKT